MALQVAYRAAVDGRHPGNKSNKLNDVLVVIRRLLMAAAVLLTGGFFSSAAHAQAGPFAGMAGIWAGGGVVTLDDGSRERIRCRASYAVAGANMTMTLTCASDAYKFRLTANVADQAGAVTGSWSEASRGIAGILQGRGVGGNFEVVASTAGFNADISLRTAGNRQSINMRADSQFRAASIALSR